MTEDDPAELLAEMQQIRAAVAAQGARILARWQPMLERGAFAAGAANLAHYLALRQTDLRPLQQRLAVLGLSTLGGSEAHVLATLDAVIANLFAIAGSSGAAPPRPAVADFLRGREALTANTDDLLGPPVEGREARIMVTISAKAAKDPAYAQELIARGMNVARINCAQKGPRTWSKMIGAIRTAAVAAGRRCPILMDLQGPKIRTRTVLTPGKRSVVKAGDRILLTFEEPRARKAFAFQASCALPEVLRQVAVGAAVSIKDGLIVATVEEVRPEGLVICVERTPPEGQPLEEERGINFPDVSIDVSPLTAVDLDDLDFVARHADMVGFSFVQRPEDIARLQKELKARRGDQPPLGIVAKIETKLAFANLPEMIVQAAGHNPFAVMIARGDLAVEIGYERLSEVQEEILWVCEAASVPVIWATQVLESLVKRGMPSRGEFTDAAMSNRAECVMLNKGPYIAEGIAVLDNVLRRMEQHMRKKSPQLRALSAWREEDASG